MVPSQVRSDRTRRNDLKLLLKLHISNDLFTGRVIKHRHRLPREVAESTALEVFKRLVDVALRDMV